MNVDVDHDDDYDEEHLSELDVIRLLHKFLYGDIPSGELLLELSGSAIYHKVFEELDKSIYNAFQYFIDGKKINKKDTVAAAAAANDDDDDDDDDEHKHSIEICVGIISNLLLFDKCRLSIVSSLDLPRYFIYCLYDEDNPYIMTEYVRGLATLIYCKKSELFIPYLDNMIEIVSYILMNSRSVKLLLQTLQFLYYLHVYHSSGNGSEHETRRDDVHVAVNDHRDDGHAAVNDDRDEDRHHTILQLWYQSKKINEFLSIICNRSVVDGTMTMIELLKTDTLNGCSGVELVLMILDFISNQNNNHHLYIAETKKIKMKIKMVNNNSNNNENDNSSNNRYNYNEDDDKDYCSHASECINDSIVVDDNNGNLTILDCKHIVALCTNLLLSSNNINYIRNDEDDNDDHQDHDDVTKDNNNDDVYWDRKRVSRVMMMNKFEIDRNDFCGIYKYDMMLTLNEQLLIISIIENIFMQSNFSHYYQYRNDDDDNLHHTQNDLVVNRINHDDDDNDDNYDDDDEGRSKISPLQLIPQHHFKMEIYLLIHHICNQFMPIDNKSNDKQNKDKDVDVNVDVDGSGYGVAVVDATSLVNCLHFMSILMDFVEDCVLMSDFKSFLSISYITYEMVACLVIHYTTATATASYNSTKSCRNGINGHDNDNDDEANNNNNIQENNRSNGRNLIDSNDNHNHNIDKSKILINSNTIDQNSSITILSSSSFIYKLQSILELIETPEMISRVRGHLKWSEELLSALDYFDRQIKLLLIYSKTNSVRSSSSRSSSNLKSSHYDSFLQQLAKIKSIQQLLQAT
jgi:hypothetical protein